MQQNRFQTFKKNVTFAHNIEKSNKISEMQPLLVLLNKRLLLYAILQGKLQLMKAGSYSMKTGSKAVG